MRRLKKWAALMLAGIMLLTGCGASDNAETGTQDQAPAQSTAAADTEKSMGRYLEKEIALPEEITAQVTYPRANLKKLDSGELELVEQVVGKYISGDNGETWEHVDTPWLSDLVSRAYISQITLSPNGAMAVIYDPYEEEPAAPAEGQEPEDRGTASAEGQESEDRGTAPAEGQEAAAAAGEALQTATGSADFESSYVPEYLYVDAEGNRKDIEFQEAGNYLHSFWFGKDSTLYASDLNHCVYAVDTESGAFKKLFETEGLADYICFTEKYMIAISSRGITIYDLEKGMTTEEDKVLQDFIMENIANSIGANSDSHALVAVEGEQEDVIYFAFNKGLYRHVIGGTVMEQVVDGNISSLGDPMMYLRDMVLLPDNEFIVLYNDAKLYRYVYDPDIPTVPDQQLSVYSLTEDYTIRQAVSLFQKQNPDVYVRYEVGMTGSSGMTSEDAIKNLNTKIMSGSGPDVLVLDGLPADSYKEKGILADLSSLEESMEGEESLFPNLVDACREDGKLYALPVRFRLPMIAGEKESVEKVKDLESLADVVEELREKNPKGSLLGLWSEEEVLYTLGTSSSASWVNENGEIDEEKLTEFLSQARRIYQAEIAGLDEAEITEHQENYSENWSMDVTGEGRYYANVSAGALDIAMETQKLAVGKADRLSFDYNTLATLSDELENFSYGSWQGQIPNGFIPSTMTGICAGSMENELAVEFYRYLFGRELQDIDLPGGFPVNMASFDHFSTNPDGDEFNGDSLNGCIAISDTYGNKELVLDIRWANEEEFQKLKETVQSLSAICTGDSVIEQAVCETGGKALNGSFSVEDTVAEIVKKAAIYLAE